MASRVLVVEGSDDERVITHTVVRKWRVEDLKSFCEIARAKGEAAVLETFRAGVLAPEAESVGLVLDADDRDGMRVQNRWDAVRGAMARQFNQPFVDRMPTSALAEGWTAEAPTANGSVRVGVWVMPNNRDCGAVEAFVREMLDESSKLWQFALRATDEAKKDHEAHFEDKDQAKARLAAWLAWQRDPGTPYGTAIRSKFLDPDRSKSAGAFLAWWEQLFGIPK